MTDRKLLIQNSTGVLCVGLSEGGHLVFDSTTHPDLVGSRDIQGTVQRGLDVTGHRIAGLTHICVDIGPGGLGATRSGVAFANALGFAADIPVLGLHAFDVIGRHAFAVSGRPVMCIRPAARPNFYIGYYDNTGLHDAGFVDKAELLTRCHDHTERGVFAGKFTLTPEQSTPPNILTNLAPLAVMLEVAQMTDETPGPVWPITESMWGAHV